MSKHQWGAKLNPESRHQDRFRSRLPKSRPLQKWIKVLTLGLGVASISFLFQNCQNAEIGIAAKPAEIDSPPNQTGELISSPTCHIQSLRQPQSDVFAKTDILFITDTSGSLDSERGQIANQLDSFVMELPQTLDFRIAVMPAHGSKSSYAGKLYQKTDLPLILDSTKISIATMRSHLMMTLKGMPGDDYSDGGEEGLYSLNRALEPDSIAKLKTQGFLRDNASLAVIFISDENDICYRYPSSVIRVPDPEKREIPAFKLDCGNVTPESVYAKLKNYMGSRPLLVSGIVYSNPTTIPKSGENEMGYGYLDIISLNKGVVADLASTNFHEGLAAIGKMMNVRLNLLSEFPLQFKENIDPKSLTVMIDGKKVAAQIVGDSVQLGSEIGVENSLIEASYCEAQ